MEPEVVSFFEEMSNYELLELYFTARSAIGGDITIFMSVLFAFLGVTYLVVDKLTRFQAISTAILYSTFMLYVTFGAYDAHNNLSTIVYAMTGDDISDISYFTAGILVVAWLLSIVLFIEARNERDT